MAPYRELLGGVAVIVGFIGYVPYFRDIFRGKTKPHFFSWFIWSLLTGIAFLAQLVDGAGPGAWVNAMTTLGCATVAAFALVRGEKKITALDWFCFVSAFLGVLLWIFTSNPLWAVIIVTVVDFIAYIPTFRKSYSKPYQETLSTYILSITKYAFSLAAIASYTVTTALFPASLFLSNIVFVIMVSIRRKQLKGTEPSALV